MGADKEDDYALRAATGEAFTIATSDALCLHFDGSHIQTLMSFKDPFKLYLAYTQAMMGFKLFKPVPHSILIVGLGGGSLSKYCYTRFAHATVTTVEISEDVLALRDQFQIPEDNERFKVVKADAAAYIPTLREAADVLLLDGFTSEGIPEALCSLQFYNDCRAALTEDGLLVANLHGEDPRFQTQLKRISVAFLGNCLIGYAEDHGNYVVIASNGTRKLCDDIQTDLRRLVAKTKKHLTIPHFETLETFFAKEGRAE